MALFGLSSVNDFLARYADKTINRFWGVDALSQNHFDMTSYHMVLNNPLRFIDPFGLDTLDNQKANFDYSKVKPGDFLTNGGQVFNEVTVKASKWTAFDESIYGYNNQYFSENKNDERNYHPYDEYDFADIYGIQVNGSLNFGVTTYSYGLGYAMTRTQSSFYYSGTFIGSQLTSLDFKPQTKFNLSIFAGNQIGGNVVDINNFEGAGKTYSASYGVYGGSYSQGLSPTFGKPNSPYFKTVGFAIGVKLGNSVGAEYNYTKLFK